jgi:hypothetical protein
LSKRSSKKSKKSKTSKHPKSNKSGYWFACKRSQELMDDAFEWLLQYCWLLVRTLESSTRYWQQ